MILISSWTERLGRFCDYLQYKFQSITHFEFSVQSIQMSSQRRNGNWQCLRDFHISFRLKNQLDDFRLTLWKLPVLRDTGPLLLGVNVESFSFHVEVCKSYQAICSRQSCRFVDVYVIANNYSRKSKLKVGCLQAYSDRSLPRLWILIAGRVGLVTSLRLKSGKKCQERELDGEIAVS